MKNRRPPLLSPAALAALPVLAALLLCLALPALAQPMSAAEAEAALDELAPALRLPGRTKSSVAIRRTGDLLVFEATYTTHEFRRPWWLGDRCRFGGFMCDNDSVFEERVAVEKTERAVLDLATYDRAEPGSGTTLTLFDKGGGKVFLAAEDERELRRLAEAVGVLAAAAGAGAEGTR